MASEANETKTQPKRATEDPLAIKTNEEEDKDNQTPTTPPDMAEKTPVPKFIYGRVGTRQPAEAEGSSNGSSYSTSQ